MKQIVKTYPGVQALKEVDFAIYPGEVHGLVGENGAGKSTLMKILAGAELMDSGQIILDGAPVSFLTPQQAQSAGIAIIYQEFNLVPELSVAENIFLGREPVRLGFVRFQSERSAAREIIKSLGIDLDVDLPVKRCSIAQQQMVEIAKALSGNARLIAMDEPSATLTQHELDTLFALIRTLKQQGVSVIYISHRLEEIFAICDRVTVMRDGERIATAPVQDLTREAIIEKMVGRQITDEFPKEICTPGAELIRVEHLTGDMVRDVSFSLWHGEIVGLTGLVGAGRTEVARMLFGADPIGQGIVFLEGRPVQFATPRHAIDAGICLLTEDRKTQGLIMGMSIRENSTLPTLSEFTRALFVSQKKERLATLDSMRDLQIKAPSAESDVGHLSGGNQQKVVLAKWLLTHAKLFLFDEPTRGIDVGAKREIYLLMNHLVKQGAGILMISSELPEILGMADRILVMHEGRLAGELLREEATQEKIMALATGMKAACLYHA
jgi:ribose transport system ATP-binding protein